MTIQQIQGLYRTGKMSDKVAEGWLALFGISRWDADRILNFDPPY